MFISPLSGHIEAKKIEAKKAELTGTTRVPSVAAQEKRRYQYLFQSTSLLSNKSLYRQVVGLVNQFINQVMGRDSMPAANQNIQNSEKPRQVRGIADRMPRLVDPKNPEPCRDSIFLGEAKDYPAAVIAIEYNNTTKPVFYEGNQIVARHLTLDCEETSMSGKLILNDGTRIPVEIMILTAV